MSALNLRVVGLRDPEDEPNYKHMRAIYDSCRAVGVPVPDEVLEYFNYEKPDSAGLIVDLDFDDSVSSWNEGEAEGLEVVLKGLPEGLTRLRFFVK